MLATDKESSGLTHDSENVASQSSLPCLDLQLLSGSGIGNKSSSKRPLISFPGYDLAVPDEMFQFEITTQALDLNLAWKIT